MAALGMLAVFSAVPAFATERRTGMVDNTNDSGTGSLRQATLDADLSNTGDTIFFNVNGTITLTSGKLEITHSLKINGPGASSVVISGNKASLVFGIDSGATVSISNLTIESGSGSNGGGIENFGALTLSGSVVYGNSASASGGGLYNGSTGSATVTDTSFVSNAADGQGGGIFNSTGTMTVTGSTVSGNQAKTEGGGIENGGGTLTVTNTTIAGNQSFLGGGGIYSGGSTGSTAMLVNTTIYNNSEPSPYACGIDTDPNAQVTLKNTVLGGVR
jgi:hypothetical protein